MDHDLMQAAKAALKNTYVPYSNFPVGAAIRMRDNVVITGVNIENASYGLSNCAERTALFTAYAQGYRREDIVEMALASEADTLVTPCGACRQVMSELLAPDVPVHMSTRSGEVTTKANKELLPLAFSEEDLGR